MKYIDIEVFLKEHYGLDVDNIEFCRSGGSESFIVSSREGKFFYRIVSNAFRDSVMYAVNVQRYLIGKGYPTTEIRLNLNDELYSNITYKGVGCVGILYVFQSGVEPIKEDSIESIGELVGKLHQVMECYEGDLVKHDKDFLIDRYIRILEKKNYPVHKRSLFIEYGNWLWNEVKGLPFGYCHGDMYIGNIMKSENDKLILYDFDSSSISFPMYDVMVMCDSTDYFNYDENGLHKSLEILKRFMVGYCKYRDLSGQEVDAFKNLIAIRHFQLQATIIEIFGLDCVDENFLDKQWAWLESWRKQVV